jgi:hypothetical protein
MRRPWPTEGRGGYAKKKNFYYIFFKDTSFAKVNMEIQA